MFYIKTLKNSKATGLTLLHSEVARLGLEPTRSESTDVLQPVSEPLTEMQSQLVTVHLCKRRV